VTGGLHTLSCIAVALAALIAQDVRRADAASARRRLAEIPIMPPDKP